MPICKEGRPKQNYITKNYCLQFVFHTEKIKVNMEQEELHMIYILKAFLAPLTELQG